MSTTKTLNPLGLFAMILFYAPPILTTINLGIGQFIRPSRTPIWKAHIIGLTMALTWNLPMDLLANKIDYPINPARQSPREWLLYGNYPILPSLTSCLWDSFRLLVVFLALPPTRVVGTQHWQRFGHFWIFQIIQNIIWVFLNTGTVWSYTGGFWWNPVLFQLGGDAYPLWAFLSWLIIPIPYYLLVTRLGPLRPAKLQLPANLYMDCETDSASTESEDTETTITVEKGPDPTSMKVSTFHREIIWLV